MPACLQLISGDDYSAKENAALMLGAIAVSEDHKHLVQAPGVAAACVAVLDNPNATWQDEEPCLGERFRSHYQALVQLASS